MSGCFERKRICSKKTKFSPYPKTSAKKSENETPFQILYQSDAVQPVSSIHFSISHAQLETILKCSGQAIFSSGNCHRLMNLFSAQAGHIWPLFHRCRSTLWILQYNA